MISKTLRVVNIQEYPHEAIEQLLPTYEPSKLIQKSKSQHMIVAVSGSQIIGTASIDGARVRNVFVEPSFQGKGIGRMLMKEIEAHALSHGQAHLFLFAALSAIRFYEKLGFVTKGRVQHDLGEVSIEECRMEKTLNQDNQL